MICNRFQRDKIGSKLFNLNQFLIILLIFFGLNILLPHVSGLQETITEEYRGTAYCLDCHVNEMEDWLTSKHAESYRNPEFKKTYNELDSPEACLNCHTTGFSIMTGRFEIDSVSCENCHGPGNTMNVNNTVALCAECHTEPYPTYDEWIRSGPAHGQATCYNCHEEHTAGLVFNTPTETCGQCHESHVLEEESTLHGQNGVQCTDCHMAFVPANFEKGLSGYTGHSFEVTDAHLDCTTCHNRTLVKHDVLGSQAFACLSCHGEIHRLELRLVNQTVLPLNNSVQLCAQCHNERYTAWAQGTHGQPENPEAQCTECHDPHDPIITGIPAAPASPIRKPADEIGLFPKIIFILLVEAFGFAVILLRRVS